MSDSLPISHDHHRQGQAEVLQQVLAVLRADPRVLRVLVTGSYARGQQDAFSDIDLNCYHRDEERSGREDLYRRIGRVGPLLCQLWLYDRHALYLFASGVRLDVTFHKPSELEHEDPARVRILDDCEGAIERGLHHAYASPPAPHPPHFEPGDPTYVDWFLWMFRQVYCWTKRGAQGGDRAFDKLFAAADSLAQIRTSLLTMRRWTHGAMGYWGTADPGFAARIATTFPHLIADEMLAATRSLLDLYELACPAYCHKAGIPYPSRKVTILKAGLDEFDRLS